MRATNTFRLIIPILLCLAICQEAAARKIHNRAYGYKISIPDRMMEVRDSSTAGSELYYDTTARIILMISQRQSKFKSVKEYLDCSHEQLEKILQADYGDASLMLINCAKSPYYPAKGTVLQFRVSVLPFGFDTYVIYFFHHRDKDLQFAFTCKKEPMRQNLDYISSVMNTLKLR